uniref:snRNA-activating protein complex subunit 3 n=1 Tax=Anopheles atroparvus TaxID=41427 RepID=A0A182IZT7_ANOAO
MENIYKPKSNKVIHVWEALAQFHEQLYPEKLSRIVESESDIFEAIGLTGDSTDFDKLLLSIDVGEHLTNPKDVPVSSFHPSKAHSIHMIAKVPKKATQFNCVQRALEAQESKAKRNKEVKLRYTRHKYAEEKQCQEPNDLIPYREMLIKLRFYEPFKYKPGRRLGHPRFSQEYYVLSSQYLTDLKDKILCNCDEGPYYEISNKKLQHNERNGQPPPKSGFFFIHDTFYNDLREESNHDYSSVIQNFINIKAIVSIFLWYLTAGC